MNKVAAVEMASVRYGELIIGRDVRLDHVYEGGEIPSHLRRKRVDCRAVRRKNPWDRAFDVVVQTNLQNRR